MENDYIAILSLWKRGKWLKEQIEIMRDQSLPPREIWVCHGINDENRKYESVLEKADKVIVFEDGGSIFSRFEISSGYGDQYFMILDDDIFPTENYMESCFDLLGFIGKEGIIGCGGRKFKKKGQYHPHVALGVIHACPNDVKTDIGTNGWLLTSNAIDCLLRNHDRRGWNNGEDIALSYLNRRLRNVDTYTIRQDHNTKACRYNGKRGTGQEALSHPSNHKQFYTQRNRLLEHYQNEAQSI